ncbi:MAG TPA: cyclophilin-like fold protein [Acidobacteriaceae bacterium]
MGISAGLMVKTSYNYQPALQHTLAGGSLAVVGANKDSDPSTERTTNMKIRITIADRVVIANVADNATARDFVSQLPLSVSMKDLFGREKYADLPKPLSEKGPRENGYEVGDIAYWSPAHQFAVYYHQDGESIPSPGIIPIAKIDAGAEAFNVPEAVKVTIEIAE